MTTRNLDALFEPRAIAFVGASARPGSVGEVITRNLLSAGFSGPVMLVNPKGGEIQGQAVHARIEDLPQVPDLAVIATPAETVPALVTALGQKGCRAAVVISAGFESGGREAELKQAVLDAARPHLMRIVGPNCLGFLSPLHRINASFAHRMPQAGHLALVAQSGAVAAAALDWAPPHGVGFSHIVTVGDSADVDVGDLLDYLALDAETDGIVLYLEGVADARKFMSAARAAARSKPVAVIKSGRSSAGAKAAFSHTGALAGADAVYDAAFRRAGLLRVDTLAELFEAAQAFSAGVRSSGDRLAILTNGGGAGVLAVDALEGAGAALAELSAETLAALDGIAPAHWSRRNPVDILGDAHPALYGQAMEVLMHAPEVDAVLALNCPVAVASSTEAAKATADAVARAGRRHKPVLTAWLGEAGTADARSLFATSRIPTYDTPEQAITAFGQLVRARRTHELLVEAPPPGPGPTDPTTARKIVEDALRQGRTALTDPEARAVLRAYGVPVVESQSAATPGGAGLAAGRMEGKVVLKILSRDISHKSDVGGVRLGLEGASETELAARDMLGRIAKLRPEARVDGFIVEPMIERPNAEELLAGLVQDPTFGPVVMVGQGGVAVQVTADRALGLPPLNSALARDMVARTRVSKLLAGYRDRPPADLEALARVLVALGDLASDLPEVTELDINPLLCDAEGVIAVDARIGVRTPDAQTPRLAILPYPAQLARDIEVGGETLRIRPIRPTDADRLCEMVDLSSDRDVRLRFSGGLRRLTPDLARRLTQIDYDRHIALIAENPAGEILGVGRLVCAPEGDSAEFALMVRSDRQARGLGSFLLQAVVDYAAAKGIATVWGDVARDNERMREVAAHLGFVAEAAHDTARVRMTRRLEAQPAEA
ncbi:bifunctional acetate--CoA ligase family protein/GNAT family N-acetyltransferase [Phenylobacterium soli]|uniref:GNAT family N-acetyltransferase n=1 Tax=Phenylobacterium soli TaxID=2170551 RepID=A0A328AKU3_9CAUL|nr:bifunctional acetate--CoA ligase family protein/GNAT family N-acetyltransferase [Phenylobacterium soli]RAK54014.1 GNAT family N-acetyltransferase [Phenylobacterium soli]